MISSWMQVDCKTIIRNELSYGKFNTYTRTQNDGMFRFCYLTHFLFLLHNLQFQNVNANASVKSK